VLQVPFILPQIFLLILNYLFLVPDVLSVRNDLLGARSIRLILFQRGSILLQSLVVLVQVFLTLMNVLAVFPAIMSLLVMLVAPFAPVLGVDWRSRDDQHTGN
jgi:hypothetical protein